MGRKKKSQLDTDGIIKLSKLTSEDVARCYVKAVDADELGGIDIERGWEQLIEALISLMHLKYGKRFVSKLYECKVLDNELEVSNQEYVINTGPKPIYPIKIPGSNYYMYYNCSSKSLPYKLRQLFTVLGINPKKVLLDIAPYSYVDQDIVLYKPTAATSNRIVRLSETADITCNHNKVTAIEMLGVRTECRTLKELISIVLGYVSKLSEDWFIRVRKYNKDNVLKVAEFKELAVLYGDEPVKIPETDYYINVRMNTDAALAYIKDICKEFNINISEVKIYYRDLEINKLDAGIKY